MTVLACAAAIVVGQTPKYMAQQAEAGQSAYRANCAICHRPELGGRNEALRLTGPNFMSASSSRTTTDLLTLIGTHGLLAV